jgi:von Willebrand factor type A domain
MSGAAKVFLAIVILPALLFSPSRAEQSASSPPGMGSIVVNVFDMHGRVISNLTKENFRVLLNGKPVALLDAKYSVAPRRIVILLDMSGSMTGETRTAKWSVAREAVRELLAQTPDDVPIAMLTFARDVRDVFDFSNSRPNITKWLEEGPARRPDLKHLAKTALFDAILEGLKLLGATQPGDSIYAITDGGENASHATAVQTKAALLQSGVRVFTFLFAEPSLGDKANKDDFLEMVDDSGGSVFGVGGRHRPGGTSWQVDFVDDKDTQEKVRAGTRGLNILVRAFWTLELAAPSSNKESKMKLEIVDHEGKMRKDVGVTYPRLLPLVLK